MLAGVQPGGLPGTIEFPTSAYKTFLLKSQGVDHIQKLRPSVVAVSAGPEGEAAAANIAQRWLASNLEGYRQLGGKMVEKYSATTPGVPGGGGEYNVQTGFGWTNGVVLALLQDFGWQPQAAATPVGAPMGGPAGI